MSQNYLKFKTSYNKDIFFQNTLIDNIFEQNLDNHQLIDLRFNESNILDSSYISFINLTVIKDLTIILNMYNFDNIFCIIDNDSIYFYSNIYGNVAMNNNNEKIEASGSFLNSELDTFEKVCDFCMDKINKEYSYCDVLFLKDLR